MEAISFKLSGKTACFRKPDVNVYTYFTYNNIHKPALLGLFGAVVGFDGYTQLHDEKEQIRARIKELKGQEKKELEKELEELDKKLPEFYEKLQSLKVSIRPFAPNGYFSKKIQGFNNSTGYANAIGAKNEERISSYNLQILEQWLENPSWQIMILDDGSDEYKKIAEYLLDGKSVFIPYLGKNDHPANISNVESVVLSDTQGNFIDSLFIKNFDRLDGWVREEDDNPYVFQEISPYTLQKDYHFYEYKPLIFTNYEIEILPEDTYYYDGKNYAFI